MTGEFDLPPGDMKAALEYLYGPQPINEGEGFLHHLKANPTLLDPAPEYPDEWVEAINRRSQDEVHACLRCGKRAQYAIVASTPDRPRFLDLCGEDLYWLRKQMDEAERRSW